jgi:cell filamentation protein, protein adenylyltransferase
MAVLRTVVRGQSRYYYLVQTYRWEGAVRRKERYLGTRRPADWKEEEESLQREVWGETWFPAFDAIRSAYQRHQRGLPRSVLEREQEDFIVDFTYDSNRLEGSTLNYDETANLLTRGISPSSKPMRDIREAQLHASLLRRLMSTPEPVDLPHLLSWHRAIFGETKSDIAGQIRDFDVAIRGSRHIPPTPLEVRPMLLELLRWAGRSVKALHPVERAAAFHFRFENIHPFGDGNGRIGRLAMNVLLFGQGFPMLNIRYGKRRAYYRALEAASLASNPRSFLVWFFRRYHRDQQIWSRLARSRWSRHHQRHPLLEGAGGAPRSLGGSPARALHRD